MSNIPMSIAMDVAASRIERVARDEMKNGGYGADFMEFVLCKVLNSLAREKASAYATEVVIRSIEETTADKTVEKTGTVEDMVKDLQGSGVDVTVDEDDQGNVE